MTVSLSSDNWQRLLQFPFKAPDGTRKLVIGALLGLAGFVVPVIPNLLVLGYQKRLERHAIQTGELLLPEWDDWSALLLDGVKVFGATLVYLLPGILALILGFGGMLAGPIAAALMEEGGLPDGLASLPAALGPLGGLALFGVGFLLILVASLFLQVALAHLIATDEFAAAFRFREWLPILRANLQGFVLAHVLLFLVSFVVSFAWQILAATVVLCCLLPLVGGAYAMYLGVVGGAAFGLAYREGQARLAAGPPPLPVAPAA
jgi:hypothetical protein